LVAAGEAGGFNNYNRLSESRRDGILVAAGEAGGSNNYNRLSESRRDGISVAAGEASGSMVAMEFQMANQYCL